MNRTTYLDDPDVRGFVEWLKESGSRLEISLNIRRSRFVPTSILTTVVGLENVLAHYMWKANATRLGDWRSTYSLLDELASNLKNSIAAGDDSACRNACRDILTWGGNRNWNIGAWQFLQGLGNVSEYLASGQAAFSLANATLPIDGTVSNMNSMLTKVHALASNDGLPIYDSRVSAAIAALVELWRRSRELSDAPLPASLAFPAVSGARTVNIGFPSAISPAVLVYGASDTVREWSGAKLRLGWLLDSIVRETGWFLSTTHFGACDQSPSIAMRMHALEAVLFVIGYDVRCLTTSAARTRAPARARASKSSATWSKTTSAWKSVATLSERGEQIRYKGTLVDGIDVRWGNVKFCLDPEFLSEMLREFFDCTVKLGASMTNPPVGSLGEWISSGTSFSPRHASAIAPILVNEGLAKRVNVGRAISISFKDCLAAGS